MQTSETSLADMMIGMGKRARAASMRLSHLTAKDRSRGLLAMADLSY